MYDGTISNNHANQTGGGIHYSYDSSNKFGGIISDNTALEGNNIYPIENNTTEDNRSYLLLSFVYVVVIVGGATIVLFLYFKYHNRAVIR